MAQRCLLFNRQNVINKISVYMRHLELEEFNLTMLVGIHR